MLYINIDHKNDVMKEDGRRSVDCVTITKFDGDELEAIASTYSVN